MEMIEGKERRSVSWWILMCRMGNGTILLPEKEDFRGQGSITHVFHPLEHVGQVGELLDLERRLDVTSGGDVDGLDGVLPVSDVATDDSVLLKDGPEDVDLRRDGREREGWISNRQEEGKERSESQKQDVSRFLALMRSREVG